MGAYKRLSEVELPADVVAQAMRESHGDVAEWLEGAYHYQGGAPPQILDGLRRINNAVIQEMGSEGPTIPIHALGMTERIIEYLDRPDMWELLIAEFSRRLARAALAGDTT